MLCLVLVWQCDWALAGSGPPPEEAQAGAGGARGSRVSGCRCSRGPSHLHSLLFRVATHPRREDHLPQSLAPLSSPRRGTLGPKHPDIFRKLLSDMKINGPLPNINSPGVAKLHQDVPPAAGARARRRAPGAPGRALPPRALGKRRHCPLKGGKIKKHSDIGRGALVDGSTAQFPLFNSELISRPFRLYFRSFPPRHCCFSSSIT